MYKTVLVKNVSSPISHKETLSLRLYEPILMKNL